jgi:hypothetical protein
MNNNEKPSIVKGVLVLAAMLSIVVLAIIKIYEYLKDIFYYIT